MIKTNKEKILEIANIIQEHIEFMTDEWFTKTEVVELLSDNGIKINHSWLNKIAEWKVWIGKTEEVLESLQEIVEKRKEK